jgi:hypothetical protein
MSCVSIQQIDGDECIGASLPKINNNFSVIADGLCDLSNTVDDLSSTVVVLSTVIGSAGNVTNVTGTAPISVANGTSTPAISIAAATASAAGSMSATDKARIDDASGVNGIVQCNGAGDFSSAGLVASFLQASTFTGTNQSLAANGYQHLPGGLIIQWGKSSAANGQFVNFTKSFPNTVFHFGGTAIQQGGGYISLPTSPGTFTKDGFYVQKNGGSSSMTFLWFAIGR